MNKAWLTPREIAHRIGVSFSNVCVVTQSQLLELPEVSALIKELQQQICVDLLDFESDDLEDLKIGAQRLACDSVIAIGGGSVIDRAKVIRHLSLFPHDIHILNGSQRCGLRWLSSRDAYKLPLIAIPTTLGTGAEVSSGAVVHLSKKPILVRGTTMVPDMHYKMIGTLQHLPSGILISGVCEILFRTLAPFIESNKSELPDYVQKSVEKLVECGNSLMCYFNQPGVSNKSLEDILENAFRIGEETHGADFHKGLYPYGSRGWYIANEVACYTGSTKMESLIPCWLAIISLCEEGTLGWSNDTMLSKVCSVLSPEMKASSLLASLTGLFFRWGMSTSISITKKDYSTLANSLLWRWGWGLPMLNDLDLPLVNEVLARAAAGPRTEPLHGV